MASPSHQDNSVSLTSQQDVKSLFRPLMRWYWKKAQRTPSLIILGSLVLITIVCLLAENGTLKTLGVVLLILLPTSSVLSAASSAYIFASGQLRKLGQSVRWNFDGESIAWDGERAGGHAPWTLIDRVYVLPDAWILSFDTLNALVVLLGDTDEDARRRLREMANRNGVKIQN